MRSNRFLLVLPACFLSLFSTIALPQDKPSGETSEVKRAYQSLLRTLETIGPDSAPKNDLQFGVVQVKRDWLQDKIDTLELFISTYPKSQEANKVRLLLAENYMALNRIQAAKSLTNFVADLSTDPNDIARARMLSGTMNMRSNLEEAISNFMQAASITTEDSLKISALTQAANVHAMLKDGIKARECYQVVVEQFPDNPESDTARAELWKFKVEDEKLLEVGKPAIPFDLKSMDGSPLSLSRLEGKVVLLDFWATWCPPYVENVAGVRNMYESFHDKGFEIIGVSLDSNEDSVVKFIGEKELEWPQYFDGKGWKNRLVELYAVGSIPATILIDRSGVIRHKGVQGEALRQHVSELVSESGQ